MKNKIILRAIFISSLLFSECQSSNKNLLNRINCHFEFSKLNTENITKSFSENFVNRLSKFSVLELSEVYIVEVQNLSLDTMFIPFNYSRELPVYYSDQTKYFNSINDTLPINVGLPFNISSDVWKLAKNEKKCFLTPLTIHDNIAKVNFSYYLTSDKKNRLTFEAVLTKRNDELIDMTKY